MIKPIRFRKGILRKVCDNVSTKMDCWVFECKKCGHLIFIKKDKDLKRLIKCQCPECQILDDRNWIFVGEGNSKTFEWK